MSAYDTHVACSCAVLTECAIDGTNEEKKGRGHPKARGVPHDEGDGGQGEQDELHGLEQGGDEAVPCVPPLLVIRHVLDHRRDDEGHACREWSGARVV